MFSTPKSGSPVFGHTDVNSGSSTTISYPGNWFGQVSISGNLASRPAAACSGVYRGEELRGDFAMPYCSGCQCAPDAPRPASNKQLCVLVSGVPLRPSGDKLPLTVIPAVPWKNNRLALTNNSKTPARRRWIWIASVVVLLALFSYSYLHPTPLKVRTITVQRGPIRSVVSTNGKVEPVQNFEAHSPIATTVKRVLVKEGDHVRKGQLLFQLDD